MNSVVSKRTWTVFGFAALVGAAMLPASLRASNTDYVDETRLRSVQSAYLLNFTRFVIWPDNVFQSATAPFVIGVLGDDPFGSILYETVKDKRIAGRPVRLRKFSWSSARHRTAMQGCHMLFVSASEQGHLKDIVKHLNGRPVLTVSDLDDFAGCGGMIGFVRDGRRVVFEINRETLTRAGLRASSRLLKLAKTVKPKSGRRATSKESRERPDAAQAERSPK